MTENRPEIGNNEQRRRLVKNKKTFFTTVVLYAVGFYITQKSDFDSSTGLGIAMLIFGWSCILLCLVLSVRSLFIMFAKQN